MPIRALYSCWLVSPPPPSYVQLYVRAIQPTQYPGYVRYDDASTVCGDAEKAFHNNDGTQLKAPLSDSRTDKACYDDKLGQMTYTEDHPALGAIDRLA
jgi:hypothetical protein